MKVLGLLPSWILASGGFQAPGARTRHRVPVFWWQEEKQTHVCATSIELAVLQFALSKEGVGFRGWEITPWAGQGGPGERTKGHSKAERLHASGVAP